MNYRGVSRRAAITFTDVLILLRPVVCRVALLRWSPYVLAANLTEVDAAVATAAAVLLSGASGISTESMMVVGAVTTRCS